MAAEVERAGDRELDGELRAGTGPAQIVVQTQGYDRKAAAEQRIGFPPVCVEQVAQAGLVEEQSKQGRVEGHGDGETADARGGTRMDLSRIAGLIEQSVLLG